MAVVNYSIPEFFDKGCGCKLNCIHLFTIADGERIRDSLMDLSNEEKDMFLIGIFVASFKPGDESSALEYRIEGEKICRQTFLFPDKYIENEITKFEKTL